MDYSTSVTVLDSTTQTFEGKTPQLCKSFFSLDLLYSNKDAMIALSVLHLTICIVMYIKLVSNYLDEVVSKAVKLNQFSVFT